MKFKNPKGEVIEVSVPAGFVEAKASGHWTYGSPSRGVELCKCSNDFMRFGIGDGIRTHTYCYCADGLHGEARVPSIQEAQSEETMRNLFNELKRLNDLVESQKRGTPEPARGQWWFLSVFGLGWVKIQNVQHLRELQHSGYQIKFIPEGELKW